LENFPGIDQPGLDQQPLSTLLHILYYFLSLFHFISFYPILFHFISFYPILFHFISFYPILFHFFSFYPMFFSFFILDSFARENIVQDRSRQVPPIKEIKH